MERILSELRIERQRLSREINEAVAAAEEHRRTWQYLRAQDEADSPDDVREIQRQIDLSRRWEAFYMGQAVSLTAIAEWFDMTCRNVAPTAGRLFSCPLPGAEDVVLAERPRGATIRLNAYPRIDASGPTSDGVPS